MVPESSSFWSSRFRLTSKPSRFLAKCISDGELGKTASVAASAHDSDWPSCPKYRHAAASIPTTFPPIGAWEAYNAMILFLEQDNSSRVARIISMNFSKYVRLFFRINRTVCIVRVLPPLTTLPAFMFCIIARASDTGFTPG
ncbi:hypothetical protein SDC9_76344 [bioreactor metagenome]|uniref:Uncharacterized protein n=1 Tax=bioreactor metagenome TaxID=1076179 RepID=A0A644YTK8_9ZZZZ